MTIPDATEVNDAPVGTLSEALAPDSFREALLAGVLDGVPSDLSDRVLARSEAVRAYVLNQFDAIPVEEDQQWTLALAYLELKSQWMQRQVRVCYEEMVTGACDREVALEASALSLLLSRIEPLLNPAHLHKIHEIFVSQLAD